jgi:Flp pilus assembly protein TadD
MRRAAVLALSVVGTGLAAAAGWWWYRLAEGPPAKAESPFLNTRPAVKYVGDDRCAECHADVAASYRAHPMGRSVSPAARLLPGQREAPRAFTARGLEYAVELGQGRVVHREVCRGPGGAAVTEQAEEVTFAVGSGRQGQSFLLDRGGAVFLSPVSWYSARQAWDLSPNFEERHDHFDRVVVEGCLFCHANEARAVPGSVNRYAGPHLEPIGCERCHGPGELHVAARLGKGNAPAGPDRTIVNPANLEPPLRDSVCEQCHLQGETRVERRDKSLYDYRPGLPLSDFVAVFVWPPGPSGARKAVSHAEQVAQSKCFAGSGGKLGCISCHDPHALPPERQRVEFYRDRCLACHAGAGCSVPEAERRRQSPPDSCVECHMPRQAASNIAHAAVTDHRVVRRPSPGAPEPPPAQPLLLAEFHPGREGEGGRERGMALAEMADVPASPALRRQVAAEARRLLEPVVRSDPADARAWAWLGVARWRAGSPGEALAALDEALRLSPQDEKALQNAGGVALELKDLKQSEEYWRRLVALNPSLWRAQASLAQVQALQGRYAEALDGCRRALALNPLDHGARLLLVNCLLGAGARAQARAELETLLVLRPAERDNLRAWFEAESAAAGPPPSGAPAR